MPPLEAGDGVTFIKPDKPAKIRGMSGTLTISTDAGSVSADGMYTRGTATTETSVPASLSIASPAEAFKMGHDTDETVYKLRCPLRHPDGTDIRLTHDQRLTMTNAEYPSGGAFIVIGRGQPQGRSGIQTAIARKDNR